MGVMKMGNSVYRAAIEPTSLAFRASVLTITSPRLPDIITLYTPTCLCGSLPEKSVQTTIDQVCMSFVSINRGLKRLPPILEAR